MAKLSDQPKYEENPFTQSLVGQMEIKQIATGKQTVQGHRVSVNGKAKDATLVSYVPKIVDRQEFVKIYTGHFKTLFELSKSTQKVFAYIADQCTRIDSDKVFIDFVECKKYAQISGKNTLANCIAELCEKDIIKCSTQRNIFFINSSIIFNGNRIMIVQEFISESDSKAYQTTKGLLATPNTNFLNEKENG